MEQKPRPGIRALDFNEMIAQLGTLSNGAQATFLKRYANTLTPSLARTMSKYAFQRLDEINKELPLENPYRQRYEEERLKRQQAIGLFIPSDVFGEGPKEILLKRRRGGYIIGRREDVEPSPFVNNMIPTYSYEIPSHLLEEPEKL